MTTSPIAHLGHVSLVTPDLDRSVGFFRDLLGMTVVAEAGDSLYLRCYQEHDHHSLVLTEGPEAVVDHIGWRATSPTALGEAERRVRATGVEVEQVDGGPGHGPAIRFHTAGGEHPFEVFHEVERPLAAEGSRSILPSNSQLRSGLGVRRIDHVNLWTAADAVAEAETWLADVLGFRRREYIQPTGAPLVGSWMSVTPQVHDVALMGDPSSGARGRFHHVAFNLENLSDALTAADQMADRGIQIDLGPGKHGIGQGMYLYVRDPGSGHRVELYAGGYLILAPD